MLKKGLVLLSVLTMVSCTNNTTSNETNDEQVSRLLKEADKKVETKEVVVQKETVVDGEKVVEETVEVVPSNSHEGMTRGQIMEYEMTRVSDEMNALQEQVNKYQEKKAYLKDYQEKLQRLEKLNDAGLSK